MRYNIKFSVTKGKTTDIKFEVHFIDSKIRFYESILELLRKKYPEGEIKILKTRDAREGVSHGL
jgi:hypothetical protein